MRIRPRVMLAIAILSSVSLGLVPLVQSVASVDSNNPDPYSWPTYQNDLRHSGYSASPGPLGNQTIWKYTTNESFYSTPTIVNGVLYAVSDQAIYALNASTGTLLWRYNTIGPFPLLGGLSYAQYVGGFSVLNSSIGAPTWDLINPYPGTCLSPAVYNGVVYAYGPGTVSALNTSTGSLIWGFRANGTEGFTKGFTPAINGNRIIFTYRDLNWYTNESVYAFDTSTGSLAWKFTPKTQFYASPDTSPTIADGMVFVGYDNGIQYALDEATGTMLWSSGTQIWIKAGNQSGNGYAANGHTTPVATAYGRVYFGATGNDSSSSFNIYGLNQFTGQKIWTYLMNCWVNGPAAVAGDEVFLTGNDGYVYALNAETGGEVWKYMAGNGTMSSPCVAGGIVYVASNNSIYAIGGGDLSYAPSPIEKPPAPPSPTPIIPPLPTSTPSTIPTPTAVPSTTPSFEMKGNITASQISGINWVTNQTTTSISFSVTGENGTFGFSNITIAKSQIPQASTPVIYVDGKVVSEQGYSQDANNYYVWYIVHFSTHRIVIEFNGEAAVVPQTTNQVSGAEGEFSFQSVVYGLAIAFVIVAGVTVVLKLALNEKKKP